jgi:transcriptional regulator with XRE-family HTH domain
MRGAAARERHAGRLVTHSPRRPPAPRAASPVGDILREWRGVRGKSQLDLSADTGVTQKHISFVESGRSRPGRQLLLHLAEALDIPLRERNALLLAAGFAPAYSEAPLDGPAVKVVHDALQRMLRQHEPFPAVAMDRRWNVLFANEAAPRFFGCFVDLAAWPRPRNLLHLVFDPAGLRPFVANWAQAARALLARVRREAVGHAADDATRRLLDELRAYPGIGPQAPAADPGDGSPIVPLSFRRDGVVLNYFSLVTTVGTPQAVAAEEIRLECMFPADDATQQRHERFVAEHRRPA